MSALTGDEFKRRLGLILAHEERADVDWKMVEGLCDQLAADAGMEAPLPVQEYLATFHRRRSDAVFAHAQRSGVIRYLRAG